MEEIGRVGGLWRYPVKSMSGEPLQTAHLDRTGIIGDRRWALRSPRTNELVNCKAITSLLTIGASYDAEPDPGFGVVHAVITLPDGRRFRTDDPSANTAISAIAGQPLELWPLLPASEEAHYRLRKRFTPELTKQRMGLRPDDPYPDFSAYEPDMIEELQYYFSPRGSYKDAYPLHYVTSTSLQTLESHEPGIDVNPRRFRPNFYIEGMEDEGGFPELDWLGYDMIVGDAVLACAQETIRCVMPSQRQVDLKAEPHMGFLLNRVTGLKFGAYCHIRKPGAISVGDKIYLERQPDAPRMVYDILPLPDDLAKGTTPEPPPVKAFYEAEVVAKHFETPDVATFGFRMAGGEAFPYLPGQHLIFRLQSQDGGRPVMRSYSISSAAGARPGSDYTITVKRIGVGSSHLLDHVDVGDRLDVRWPSGRFFVIPENKAPLALISNGIGVTPMFGILESVAATNPGREILWVHATRDGKSHIFKNGLKALKARLGHIREWTVYRQPAEEDALGRDYHGTEYLCAEDLQALQDMPGVEVFLCGSERFTVTVAELVAGLGIAEDHIHIEKFFSTARSSGFGAGAPDPNEKPRLIRFTKSGVEAEWRRGDPTLLEIAEQSGISADYGCRFGACLACSVPVRSGEVKYDDKEIRPNPGEVLICCAEPLTDLELDI